MDRSSTLRASTNSSAETLQYWLITGQPHGLLHAAVQRFRVRSDVPAERRVDVRMSQQPRRDQFSAAFCWDIWRSYSAPWHDLGISGGEDSKLGVSGHPVWFRRRAAPQGNLFLPHRRQPLSGRTAHVTCDSVARRVYPRGPSSRGTLLHASATKNGSAGMSSVK